MRGRGLHNPWLDPVVPNPVGDFFPDFKCFMHVCQGEAGYGGLPLPPQWPSSLADAWTALRGLRKRREKGDPLKKAYCIAGILTMLYDKPPPIISRVFPR